MLNKITVLMLLVLISMSATAAEVKSTSQTQLMSLLNAPTSPTFIVLDVRSDQEYSAGHIPGAINIAHTEIANNLNKLSQYKEAMVVVHCRSGRRAKVAEAALLANGFTNVHHLSGDFNGWQDANLPIEK